MECPDWPTRPYAFGNLTSCDGKTNNKTTAINETCIAASSLFHGLNCPKRYSDKSLDFKL